MIQENVNHVEMRPHLIALMVNVNAFLMLLLNFKPADLVVAMLIITLTLNLNNVKNVETLSLAYGI